MDSWGQRGCRQLAGKLCGSLPRLGDSDRSLPLPSASKPSCESLGPQKRTCGGLATLQEQLRQKPATSAPISIHSDPGGRAEQKETLELREHSRSSAVEGRVSMASVISHTAALPFLPGVTQCHPLGRFAFVFSHSLRGLGSKD